MEKNAYRFSSRDMYNKFHGDIKRVSLSYTKALFEWGMSVVMSKWYEKDEKDAVSWFTEYHWNKHSTWYRASSPPGVPTSISGQEGYHGLLQKLRGGKASVGALLKRLVEHVIPMISRDYKAHRADPQRYREREVAEDKLHLQTQARKGLVRKLPDGRWLYMRKNVVRDKCTSEYAEWWLSCEKDLASGKASSRSLEDWYKFTNADCISTDSTAGVHQYVALVQSSGSTVNAGGKTLKN